MTSLLAKGLSQIVVNNIHIIRRAQIRIVNLILINTMISINYWIISIDSTSHSASHQFDPLVHARAKGGIRFVMAGNTKAVVLGADDVGAVVVDCGSWEIRFGNAGDDSPRVVVPACAGVRSDGTQVGGSTVENAPLSFNDVSSVYGFDPQTGTASIRDWDAMRSIWIAALKELAVEDAPLLIVEPSRAWPPKQRARALELAFEGVNAPAAYVARGSAMTAFSFARTTACVVDVGHQGATAVPVVEGYALQKSTQISAVGGHFLLTKMATWADERLKKKDSDVEMTDTAEETPTINGEAAIKRLRAPHEMRRVNGRVEDISGSEKYASLSAAHREFFRLRVVHAMKESLLRVAPEPDSESPATAESYTLPDGQTLVPDETLGSMANALFENHPVDKSQCAISNLAFDAISAADVDSRRELYGGVVLTGGCSLINGTSERFTKELAVLTPQPYKLKVQGTQSSIERTCGPWIGGSIVASLGTFQNAWVSKFEYDENGAVNALRKCP